MIATLNLGGPSAPLIPPGRYEALGGGAILQRVHGIYKLFVEWEVQVPTLAEPGRKGVPLNRYYNLHAASPEQMVPRHGDYARDWMWLTGRGPIRGRYPPSVFRGAYCEVEVRTVGFDRHRQPLPEAARYSVVARLLKHHTGGGL